jgi:hypothetical protein
MSKHHPRWFLIAWTSVVLLAAAFFFCGCTHIDMQKYIAKTEVHQAGTDGPWAEFIQEKNQLTDCQSAKESYKIAIALDTKFQAILDSDKIPHEIKVVVSAEQAGLWQLENDLVMWANTNCKTA